MEALIGGAVLLGIFALVIGLLVRKSGEASRQEQIADQISEEVGDAERVAEIQSQAVPRGRALLDRIRRRSGLPDDESG